MVKNYEYHLWIWKLWSLISVNCNYNGFETFFEGVYIKTEIVAFVVMTKQTGAKLARIDVSVVGEEAQIAERQAKLLKWSNIGGNVNLISHCMQFVLWMYRRKIRYFHGQFWVPNSLHVFVFLQLDQVPQVPYCWKSHSQSGEYGCCKIQICNLKPLCCCRQLANLAFSGLCSQCQR